MGIPTWGRIAPLIVAGVVIAALAGASSAAAATELPAAATSVTLPVLASGVSSITSGTITASVVAPGMKKGDPAKQSRVIAAAPIDAAGQYVLRADPTSAASAGVIGAAASNDGWVNIDLVALGNGQMAYQSISRELVDGQWVGPNDSTKTAAMRRMVRLPNRHWNYPCTDFSYVVSEGDTNGTVGELHTGDNQNAWFRYGSTADSSFDVGYQNPIGSAWTVNGNVHVGNGLSAYVQWNEGAQWGYKLRSNFHFKKEHHDLLGCGISWLTIKASRWNSGSVVGDNVHDVDNNCRNMGSTRQSYSPGSDFQRSAYNATWFSGAFSAFGFSARAQSGFSNYVISHWHHGTAYPAYYHCGSDDVPPYAHRVYSGW